MQNVRTSSSKVGRHWWGIHGIVNTNCTPFAAVRDKQIALMFNRSRPSSTLEDCYRRGRYDSIGSSQQPRPKLDDKADTWANELPAKSKPYRRAAE